MIFIGQSMASVLYGFKETDDNGYPCYYCGELTTQLDEEAFHVCVEHQREYGMVGFTEMEKRYPLAGKDERNPEYFTSESERRIARAKELKPTELEIIIKQGCSPEREHARTLLDGGTLTQSEMAWLGARAEQLIDE